ncbi:ribokinase [Telmatobacter sp. DSM 110680]|uniref:Ribokinase n=1 Tax=Telmatobacter sp. DSM 110680 TaxID=3036704 RepID=A0AAU7DLQ5_9BACT
MRKSIVVVGSLNLDLVARVKRLPNPGETIIGKDFNTYGGGKGANQAVALARLGAPVKMIGKLGSDGFAKQLNDGLNDAGVDTSLLQYTTGSSGTALITTAEDGENTIVVIPGANGALLPEDLERHREQIEQAAMVLGQLEIQAATTECLGRLTQAAGVPFILDPAPAYSLSQDLLRSVTWLTPNETEAQLLLDAHYPGRQLSSPPEVADQLLKLGVRNVILKLGARGVYMAGADVENTYVDGFKVQVVDTTAAGDAFNGAFAFAVCEKGMAPRDAAHFACAVAAISVTRAGAQTSMPRLAECDAFLKKSKPKFLA